MTQNEETNIGSFKDSIEDFEEALAKKEDKYVLRLYVAGMGPNLFRRLIISSAYLRNICLVSTSLRLLISISILFSPKMVR